MKSRDMIIGAAAFIVGFVAVYLLMGYLLPSGGGIPKECPTMADMGGQTSYGNVADVVYVGPASKGGKQVCSVVFEYHIAPVDSCGKISLYFEPGDKMMGTLECVTETQSQTCSNSCAGALQGAKNYIKQFV